LGAALLAAQADAASPAAAPSDGTRREIVTAVRGYTLPGESAMKLVTDSVR
jgi:hypothetical protein